MRSAELSTAAFPPEGTTRPYHPAVSGMSGACVHMVSPDAETGHRQHEAAHLLE